MAEDEEVNYFYLEALFEEETEAQYKLIHAKNGQEAVDVCRGNRTIELVLMDIKMPVMNGFEATEKIKSEMPKLPVIALTAYSTQSDRQLALQHGCDDFVSKPINEEKLFNLIKTHIRTA